MSNNTDMKGKVAIVTGAASGLGRATALKLGGAGADLCLVDINQQGLEETAAMLANSGVRTSINVADLSSAETCFAVVAKAVTEFGRLDALCNIAGIIIMCNAHEMPAAQWQKTLDINLSGPFFLMQAAIPHLLETNGAIVNVTSSAAFVGESYAGAYCASKAGLTHLTKALAMEYTHKPIRINAVAPGGMITNIAASMKFPEDTNFDLVKRYSGMRGTVEVDDVAEMILMLSSDAGRGFHGACINIDKGITAG